MRKITLFDQFLVLLGPIICMFKWGKKIKTLKHACSSLISMTSACTKTKQNVEIKNDRAYSGPIEVNRISKLHFNRSIDHNRSWISLLVFNFNILFYFCIIYIEASIFTYKGLLKKVNIWTNITNLSVSDKFISGHLFSINLTQNLCFFVFF